MTASVHRVGGIGAYLKVREQVKILPPVGPKQCLASALKMIDRTLDGKKIKLSSDGLLDTQIAITRRHAVWLADGLKTLPRGSGRVINSVAITTLTNDHLKGKGIIVIGSASGPRHAVAYAEGMVYDCNQTRPITVERFALEYPGFNVEKIIHKP